MKILRITVIIIIVFTLGTFFFFLADKDPQALLIHLMEKWDSHYLLFLLIIFAITLLSTLSGLPVLYLSVVLGFFMPYTPAFAFAWGSNLFASLLCFIMIRRLFYSYFKKKYGSKKLIRSLNKRIKKYNFWTVAVSRSIYFIPTNIINFSFPLSKISFKNFTIGTMIGLVPESLINISSGYLLKHQILLLSEPRQNMAKIIVIGAYLLLLVVLMLYLRYRKNKDEKASINKITPLFEDN